jgi:gliding motility-associated-like protein
MKKNIFKIIVIFLFFQFSYSQLADFSLSVTKTDETRSGNGSLTFITSNTTAGASIIFSVYLLPNTTTPISVLTDVNLTGLNAGTYRVVALQSLGALSNSQQQDITIIEAKVSLIFQVYSSPLLCYETNGTIAVNVSQGFAATYEIINGPIIIPPQTSNIFTNLIVGTYDIRVNDQCGDGVVQTHTIEQLTNSNLFITVLDPPLNEYCGLVDCNTRIITVEVSCTPGTTIHYPIEVQAIVTPPNSSTPVIVSQIITSGPPTILTLEIQIPYYNVESYSFFTKVIGTCGEEFQDDGTTIAFPSSYELIGFSNIICQPGLILRKFCNLLPPYYVEFLSAPAGFNPALFNPNNLGPFNSFFIQYASSGTAQMPTGNYQIQLTDSCGTSIVREIVLGSGGVGFTFENIPCSDNDIFTLGTISSILFVDAPPEFGQVLPYDASDLITPLNNIIITLPPGTYFITGVDICGNSFQLKFTINPREFIVSVNTENLYGCDSSFGQISLGGNEKLTSVIMLLAPSNFTLSLPHDYSGNINQSSCQILNLPPGAYVFEVTSECGDVLIVNAIVPVNISYSPLVLYEGTGCGPGFDSVAFTSQNGSLTQFVIIAAPSSFPFALPYDCSFNIGTNGFFCMNSLPVGTYTFYSKDVCDVERTETLVLHGFQGTENIQINPNCGSFDIDLQFPNNNNLAQRFWLQKFNPLINKWVHPLNGTIYIDNTIPNVLNSYPLVNLAVNYNIAAVGNFRIFIEYDIYENGDYNLKDKCLDLIKSFEFTGALNITSTYTLTCNSGAIELAIIANGVPPFLYSITTKNGLPFLVNNGNSNLFTGLEPAIYNFQIIDSCGNILNKLIDINSIGEPTITPNNLCDGQIGQLTVPAISYLNYQWWKGNDTTTILSTSSVLTFNPFSSITSPGTYYARIYSTTAVSCTDKILSFVVTPTSLPNAGQDGQLTICGTSAAVNLFTLLNGTFDTNGSWQEITTSGALNGNIWSPNGINFGSYIFKYTVNGFCNDSDDSLVTINFNPAPPIPEIDGGTNYCIGQPIEFLVDDIPGATFQWTGPNNFSSNNQNIIIHNASQENAGDYIVKATLYGCESTSTINININPNPDFSFEELCVGTNYTIKIIPVGNSFDPSNVTYLWTGPNGFTNSTSQIVVTNQQTGNYSVTITDSNECSQTKSINVQSAFCEFPNFITPNDDGSNDYFDLAGFDVDRLEIYSRWGRLVYEENDYINNWRGQNMNNKRLPDSTYYYIISLRSGEQKFGWILLAQF